jgi:hypothetical protein
VEQCGGSSVGFSTGYYYRRSCFWRNLFLDAYAIVAYRKRNTSGTEEHLYQKFGK